MPGLLFNNNASSIYLEGALFFPVQLLL
jgi:hypothetical protein